MLLLGATLALGFSLSAYMVATAMVRMRQQNSIRVKGLAEATVRSNHAIWACNFQARAAALAVGYQSLQKNLVTINDYLASAGVPANEMSANPATIETLYKLDARGNATHEVDGYVLRQSVSVRSADVDRVDRISKDITRLIEDGIELHSGSPEFVYTDIESIKLDLLGKATRNAYERAQALAANGNGKIGRLITGSQGVFQITAPHSTDVSDSGSYDTSSIEKSVRCVVTLEFQVDK